MHKPHQPKTIFVTIEGEGDPKSIAQFLRWMAGDLDDLRKQRKLHRHLNYAYDPESDYVTATAREKVSG